MIFGIGTDIVELSRVKGIYERFGDHFARRILMEEDEPRVYIGWLAEAEWTPQSVTMENRDRPVRSLEISPGGSIRDRA